MPATRENDSTEDRRKYIPVSRFLSSSPHLRLDSFTLQIPSPSLFSSSASFFSSFEFSLVFLLTFCISRREKSGVRVWLRIHANRATFETGRDRRPKSLVFVDLVTEVYCTPEVSSVEHRCPTFISRLLNSNLKDLN